MIHKDIKPTDWKRKMKIIFALIMLLSFGLSFALTLDVPVDANGWQLNTRNGNQL